METALGHWEQSFPDRCVTNNYYKLWGGNIIQSEMKTYPNTISFTGEFEFPILSSIARAKKSSCYPHLGHLRVMGSLQYSRI